MRTALVFALFLALSTPAGLAADLSAVAHSAKAEAPGAEAAAQAAVSGIVKDEAGGAVSGAVVLVTGSSGLAQQTVSGPDGRFTLAMPPTGDLTLIVRAGGFAEWTQSVPANREIDVVLHIASLFETVTVTPTRSAKRLGDV